MQKSESTRGAETTEKSALARVARGLVALVALLHVWFFVLETFLWSSSIAASTLHMTAAEAEATAVLAGNQGVYNAVIAAGLGWALGTSNPKMAWSLQKFFLGSVIAVGLYGAVSARIVVLFVQVLPAVVALALSFSVQKRAAERRS